MVDFPLIMWYNKWGQVKIEKIKNSNHAIKEARKELETAIESAVDEINTERDSIELTDVFSDLSIDSTSIDLAFNDFNETYNREVKVINKAIKNIEELLET